MDRAGDATLILGPSGVGKTIFALRFIAEGLGQGERCLYITFQDTADQLVEMAAGSAGTSTPPAPPDSSRSHHVPMGSLDLDVLASRRCAEDLAGRIVQRVVIDSLAEMVSPPANRTLPRLRCAASTGLIRAAGASLLITSETTTLGPAAEPLGRAHVPVPQRDPAALHRTAPEVGRALNIVKMRNSDHRNEIFSFTMGPTVWSSARLESVTGVLGWSAPRSPDPV